MLILREIKLNLKMLQNICELKYEPWQIKYKILKWILTRWLPTKSILVVVGRIYRYQFKCSYLKK